MCFSHSDLCRDAGWHCPTYGPRLPNQIYNPGAIRYGACVHNSISNLFGRGQSYELLTGLAPNNDICLLFIHFLLLWIVISHLNDPRGSSELFSLTTTCCSRTRRTPSTPISSPRRRNRPWSMIATSPYRTSSSTASLTASPQVIAAPPAWRRASGNPQ